MQKLNYHIPRKLTAFIFLGIILLLGGCTASKDEGFAIYLTEGDISPVKMPALSHVEITEKPIIAINDIITYNADTHEIMLTISSYNQVSSLEVPVGGKSFVVCVDKKPIYCGAFWTPISSISFDGITIWKPLNSQDMKVIKLDLGYPSPSFYRGDDPRNNTEIIKSLEQAGKLIASPSNNAADKLPHSMKGYELYSWSEDSQWHFTLITGTNRNKTLEEIISDVNITTEDGWLQIHVVGVDAIETVLNRLPQNESILWLTNLRSEQTEPADIIIQLPPEKIADAIREHAERCGLDFRIHTP